MYTKYFITSLTAALISALPITAANADTEAKTTDEQATQDERLPLRELRLFTQVF